jgi:hypothetical protein
MAYTTFRDFVLLQVTVIIGLLTYIIYLFTISSYDTIEKHGLLSNKLLR